MTVIIYKWNCACWEPLRSKFQWYKVAFLLVFTVLVVSPGFHCTASYGAPLGPQSIRVFCSPGRHLFSGVPGSSAKAGWRNLNNFQKKTQVRTLSIPPFFNPFILPFLPSFPHQPQNQTQSSSAQIYSYILFGSGGRCRGESGHAGIEGGLGAGSWCYINQKEWHPCRPWQPSWLFPSSFIPLKQDNFSDEEGEDGEAAQGFY